ncbi:KIR protein [Plasmodium coatneyi]|uniref:KIR protein n=1 Tax=Plasmodium coatneyi TaxID=208452 RepID=A0A1B1DSX9_9APIC|nr:KIR protein [Plasmodium coatneyi]ANQ05898.1 KIR protein [Plasmodium coatneyi]
MPDPEKAQATLTEDLEKLTSYKDFYDKFKKGCSDYNSCDRSSTKDLEDKLQKCPKSEKYKEKIIKACCCMSTMDEERGVEYKKKCNFLYYWTVDILMKEIGISSLSAAAQDVTGALESFLQKHGCKILDPDSIDKDTIEARKKIFDYNYDYGELQQLLKSSGSECNQNYLNYLKGIFLTYDTVKTECKRPNTETNEYCTKLKEMFDDDKKSPQQLTLKCGSIQETEAILRARAKAALQENCQEKGLPSQQIYCKLNQASGTCDSGRSDPTPELKVALKTYLKEGGDYADKIVKGWCYANGSGKGNLSNKEERCKYLYYWTADTLLDSLKKEGDLSNAMNVIYSKLGGSGRNIDCTNLYPNMQWYHLRNMGQVYNYSQDHDTIKKCTEDPQPSDSNCTNGEYSTYLDGAFSSYKYMKRQCEGDKDKQWCTDFNKMAEERTYNDLLQLKCFLKHTPDCPNITLPAILGTLTSIGLPTFAFLLYKVLT